jgi:hypothetical protein
MSVCEMVLIQTGESIVYMYSREFIVVTKEQS